MSPNVAERRGSASGRFFEKKRRKKLLITLWRRRFHARCPNGIKSFLVLFSKKNRLAYA